ncbi:ribonuclease domain-containing protein [Noviherbaspirillum sp. Root189]|uniref:ribonuclease domain-containing protein n=1 Tax=Noviherbaspirillum sp. Root189 TaxID=1736487 RepID=UPI00070AB5A1|nr:ribonuclease [Noviherbaspirillum sp. Root189]KRB73510.1 ribonuclease [Noviherbaspirillum sp. Root189]
MNRQLMNRWLLFFATLFFSLQLFAKGLAPIGIIPVEDLPREGRQTLELIKRGGPFPYPNDGRVFRNFEGVLPKQKRGYYHEFTVKTPGARNRGARRIVSGGDPQSSGEYYYTDDHYDTFRRIKE